MVRAGDRTRVGKLTGGGAVGRYEVKFVDIPNQFETMTKIDRTELVHVRLPVGHTVWAKNAIFGYTPGTVAAQMDDGKYVIRTGQAIGRDGAEIVTVRAESLETRDGTPFRHPVEAMAVGMVDQFEVYRSRIGAIRSFVAQRASCHGYTALLSAAVRPFRHQANVLVQVVSDPIRRYVLADEVGLGKTIEAGLVIRQALLDDPSAEAVVAVPTALVAQWRSEMTNKLLLGGALAERWEVVSHDELLASRTAGLRKADSRLLVVDEAHRIAERALADPRDAATVERVAQAIRGLLLLTATPIRGHADVFHYLLHLIDPLAHPKGDVAAFRSRVELREHLANSIEVLADPQVPWVLVDETLREFADSFPDDKFLSELVETALDEGDDVVRQSVMQVAEYLRETYRLSRRVIRNRRSSIPEFPVSGRRFEFLEFEEPATSIVEEFLEATRIAQLVEDAPLRFESFVDAALAGPVALLAHLEEADIPSASAELRHAVAVLRARLETVDLDARTDAAVAWIAGRWSRRSGQTVVITSHNVVAKQLAERLRSRIGERSVVLLLDEMGAETAHDMIVEFERSEHSSVLVVDRFAEEGLNLQFAEAMLHLDTPLSVNRLEQRVGRLDRFNEAIQEGKLNVTLRSHSSWERARDELHAATGVHHSSIATLQRPLAGLEAELRERMLSDGQTALIQLLDGLEDALEDERGQIERLEELEEFSGRAGFDEEEFEFLEDFEEDWGSIQSAVDALTDRTHGLYLVRVQEEANRGLFEYSPPGRRSLPNIPQPDLAVLAPILRGRRTFNRPVAVRNPGVQVVRVGDPVVDWMAAFIQLNERGRTRASLRACPHIESPQLWFQLDVLLQTTPPTDEVSPIPTQAFRRSSDGYLRPLTLNLWSDGRGPPESDFKNSSLTSLPTGPSGDRAVSASDWSYVLATFPDFAERVQSAAAETERRILGDERTVVSISHAQARIREEYGRRERNLRRVLAVATSEHADAQAELDRTVWLRDALVAGVQSPEVRVLAIGAYLLTPQIPA